MKTYTKIILTVVTTLGITGGALAYGIHSFGNMSMTDKAEMVNQKVTSKLSLNEEQKQKFSTLSKRMVTLVQQARSQSGDHKAMLQGLISDQPLDQAALLERINLKTSMINQHAPEMVTLLANFVDSLDSDQKSDLKEMIEQKMAHAGAGQGHGYGGHHRFN